MFKDEKYKSNQKEFPHFFTVTNDVILKSKVQDDTKKCINADCRQNVHLDFFFRPRIVISLFFVTNN